MKLYDDWRCEVMHQRTYGAAPNWLLTVCIGASHGSGTVSAYPQARAIVDDFGDLVLVRGWL